MEEKIRNGDTPDKKKERKEVSKTLRTLEDSEKGGQHIKNIKSVTNDGDLLLGKEPMSSQDVLARVEVIYSDDKVL